MRYLLLFLTFPAVTLAQVSPPTNFADFVRLITNLIGILIIAIFALTLLVFLWGLLKNLILKGAEEDNRKAGKNIMLWGIIVLVIMTAIWGILALLQTTFFG